ncbi:MAG: biotin--[acetyl-CoA-carboxylase] ligase [Aquificae bacterium]|nr:biotin--[acetyl-CoA-carboxylase] ligase [Aquificota bacterium]
MSLLSSLLWLREVDSTQDRLKEWELPYGSVLAADRQTKGRGRRGRKWLSQEGGLYFSFLLNPADFPDLLPLPIAVGLGVAKALENLGFQPGIKWPNDVYLSEKKVCGVLAELKGRKLIVGVGINVNQREIPEELMGRATSLFLESGRVFDRKEVLLKVLGSVNEALFRLMREGFGSLREEVQEKLLFLGEEVRLEGEAEVLEGKFAGISERGGALLLLEGGLKEVLSGEVSLRRV